MGSIAKERQVVAWHEVTSAERAAAHEEAIHAVSTKVVDQRRFEHCTLSKSKFVKRKVASSWQNSFRRIDWYTVSRVIQNGQKVRIYGSHVNDDAEVNARRAIEEAP